MDFLQNALANGRKFRTLSIEDAFSREMLAIEIDTALCQQVLQLNSNPEALTYVD
ncbi:MAG TPA: hypothetical protein VFN62_12940 [Acidobacteriaceae bacterium]|nr:hypothetical protein [Acidobacteriaceae bacterium]